MTAGLPAPMVLSVQGIVSEYAKVVPKKFSMLKFLWTLAGFYEKPELRMLIPVIALSVFIAGFNSTSLATLQRHLRLGRLMILRIGVQLASVVVMVVWALVSPSVWALVAGGAALLLLNEAKRRMDARFRRHGVPLEDQQLAEEDVLNTGGGDEDEAGSAARRLRERGGVVWPCAQVAQHL